MAMVDWTVNRKDLNLLFLLNYDHLKTWKKLDKQLQQRPTLQRQSQEKDVQKMQKPIFNVKLL